jgi:hypothetical protein
MWLLSLYILHKTVGAWSLTKSGGHHCTCALLLRVDGILACVLGG